MKNQKLHRIKLDTRSEQSQESFNMKVGIYDYAVKYLHLDCHIFLCWEYTFQETDNWCSNYVHYNQEVDRMLGVYN